MNAAVQGFQVPERLDYHLANWADWMRSGSTRGLKAPSASCGFVGGGYNTDFDSMVREADSRSAAAMDALIRGLSGVHQAAIHHRYLHAVYRFRDFDLQFRTACERLAAGMSSKCLV